MSVGFGRLEDSPVYADQFQIYTGNANPANTANLSSLAAVASGLAITAGPLLVGLAGDAFGLRNAMWLIPLGAGIGAALSLVRWGGEAGLLGQP